MTAVAAAAEVFAVVAAMVLAVVAAMPLAMLVVMVVALRIGIIAERAGQIGIYHFISIPHDAGQQLTA